MSNADNGVDDDADNDVDDAAADNGVSDGVDRRCLLFMHMIIWHALSKWHAIKDHVS